MRLLLALLMAAVPALAQQKPASDSFEKLHALMKPQADEWKWSHIPWMSDLGEARRKAAAEGKPLYVWTMAGEPLGQC